MQSIQDTGPDFANSRLNLLACLALYQHRQDKAVGIDWLSGRTRGLLWYYNFLKRLELTNLITAEYLNETIQVKAAEIKLLVALAKKAKDKHKILKQVIELEKEINIAKAMLDEITGLQSLPS